MNTYSQTFKNDELSSHLRTMQSSSKNSRSANIRKMISELNSEIDELKCLNDTFITTNKIESDKSARSGKSTESARSARSGKSTESARSAKSAKSTESADKVSELIGYNSNMLLTESTSLPSINDSFDSLDIMMTETSSDKKSLSSTTKELNALLKSTSEILIIPSKPTELNNTPISQIRRNRRVLRSVEGKLIPY